MKNNEWTSISWIRHLRTRARTFDFLIISIFSSSLGLRWLIPATIYPNSPNDDYLGVMLAHNLIRGHWFGGWSPDLLSKPPAYSFFLMIAHFIPVDPTVLIHLFYLLISLLFLKFTVDFFSGSDESKKLFIRVGFLFLAFNPAVFANDFSRIYRTSLDTLATFLFFTLFLKLLTLLRDIYFSGDRLAWKHTSIKTYSWIGISLGLTYSVMVLTRYEAIWVLIATLPVLFAVWIFSISRNEIKWKLKNKYRSGVILINLFVIATVAYLIPVGVISTINKAVYGVFEVENFFSGNYERAITLWEGVQTGKSNLSFIPVSKGQRAAVYAVSPAALSLKPFLDGLPNTGWKTHNCAATGVCDESGGGWFPWELRSAAVDSNHIRNEVQFQDFFGRLADEISLACKSELISCGISGMAPGAKPILDYSPHQLLDTSVKAFGSLFTVEQAANVNHADNGQDPAQLKVWHSTIHFNYLIVTKNSNSWMGMANTITFLRDIYKYLLPIFFILAMLFLFIRQEYINRISKFYLFSLILGLITYSGGMAIFESSVGFNVGYSLYALPMQPVLLMFIIFGSAAMTLRPKEIL